MPGGWVEKKNFNSEGLDHSQVIYSVYPESSQCPPSQSKTLKLGLFVRRALSSLFASSLRIFLSLCMLIWYVPIYTYPPLFCISPHVLSSTYYNLLWLIISGAGVTTPLSHLYHLKFFITYLQVSMVMYNIVYNIPYLTLSHFTSPPEKLWHFLIFSTNLAHARIGATM